MSHENLVVTQARLAGLIGGLGYPNPDDDAVSGNGRTAQTRSLIRGPITLLNPQPEPPGKIFAAAMFFAVHGFCIKQAFIRAVVFPQQPQTWRVFFD